MSRIYLTDEEIGRISRRLHRSLNTFFFKQAAKRWGKSICYYATLQRIPNKHIHISIEAPGGHDRSHLPLVRDHIRKHFDCNPWVGADIYCEKIKSIEAATNYNNRSSVESESIF